MNKSETSFWGAPSVEPQGKEVSRFTEVIRKEADKYSNKRALLLCASALSAITFYVVQRFKPREALVLLDQLKSEILGQ